MYHVKDLAIFNCSGCQLEEFKETPLFSKMWSHLLLKMIKNNGGMNSWQEFYIR